MDRNETAKVGRKKIDCHDKPGIIMHPGGNLNLQRRIKTEDILDKRRIFSLQEASCKLLIIH